MNEDLCARENLARQQGCIEAMQDDIHELKEGVKALRRDSQETWKVVNRIEAKMDAESNKHRDFVSEPANEPGSSTNITLTFRQVIVIIAAFAFVILMLFGCDFGAFL